MMTSFDDNEYGKLIGDLIHDTNYINISNTGKMSQLRKHAEVLIRKILDIGNDVQIMLGQIKKKSDNPIVKNKMENLEADLSDKLIKIINRVKRPGNAATHTQHTESFSDEEIRKVEDALLDLYALIFIKYFIDIKISIYTAPFILTVFSLLPPNIRYKTWNYLYEKDINNIQVVNKLCLSIIKTFDKKKAYKWLRNNRKEISAIPYPTDSEIKKYIKTACYEKSPGEYLISLNFDLYNNMYDLLYAKIASPKTSINESGKMYDSFESAIIHYRNFIKDFNILSCSNNSDDVTRMNSLVNFVFIGRKSELENK